MCLGGTQWDCLKAWSNTFFVASLELKLKSQVCLPLQLKGMEEKDVTPRKRQSTVVAKPRE